MVDPAYPPGVGPNGFTVPYVARALATGSIEKTDWSGRIGLDFKPREDVLLYGTVARGYLGPTVTFSGLTGQKVDVDPQTVTDVTLGVKSQWLDRRLTLNGNVFYDKYKNLQTSVFNGLEFLTENAGGFEAKGLEIELGYRLSSRFGIDASYTLSDTEFTDYVTACPNSIVAQGAAAAAAQCNAPGSTATTRLFQAKGFPLTGAPKHTATFGTDFRQPIGASLQLEGSLNYYYRSETQYDVANSLSVQDGYGTLGAAIGIGSVEGNWRATVFVRNALDERFHAAIIGLHVRRCGRAGRLEHAPGTPYRRRVARSEVLMSAGSRRRGAPGPLHRGDHRARGGSMNQAVALRAAIASLGSELGPAVLQRCQALFADEQARLATGLEPAARDLAYGSHPRHRLDLYAAHSGQTVASAPVLVWVHGGGFVRGDKRSPDDPFNAHVGRWAARQGFVGVVMNYRLAPESTWPSGGEDVGAVVDWLKANVARHGGDPDRLVLVGTSAGSVHVSTFLQRRPGNRQVRGAVLLSGLYGATPLEATDRRYFGELERLPLSAPRSMRWPDADCRCWSPAPSSIRHDSRPRPSRCCRRCMPSRAGCRARISHRATITTRWRCISGRRIRGSRTRSSRSPRNAAVDRQRGTP